jgi:hypothetical protein
MRAPAETTVAVLRNLAASLDEADEPRPFRRALYAQLLQEAQERWRNSRGRRKRDEAMRAMLRISKALDQA